MRSPPPASTLGVVGAEVPRILATGFAPVPGSSRDAAALLSLALAVRGNIDLIAMKTSRSAHSEYMMGARMFRVPVGTGSVQDQRRLFGRAIVRQLQSERYDVVHVRGPIEGALAVARKAEDGFRFVYEMASFPEGRNQAEWQKAHDVCCAEADLVLVPTHAAARALAREGHGRHAAVLAPGVDIHRFDWWPAATSDVLRILFLGNFVADRDLDTLLSAAQQLNEEQPVELLLAGDPNGQRRATLRARADAFGLSDRVFVRGEPRSELTPMIVGAADVCVCSAAPVPRFQSYGDIPEPLLEYLACQRAVIAAAVPGMEEMVSDQREALHYEPGNAASLHVALRRVAQDQDLRQRLVAAAHRRVRTAFSGGARRRRLAEIYELLSSGSQVYDPWEEAFDPLETGQSVLPTDGMGPDDLLETHDTVLRPSRPGGNEYFDADAVDDADPIGGQTTRTDQVTMPQSVRQRRGTIPDPSVVPDPSASIASHDIPRREVKDTIDCSREDLGMPDTGEQPQPRSRAKPSAGKKSDGPPEGGRRSKRS